jgi:glycerophosphoryl diester phosphodiesterase
MHPHPELPEIVAHRGHAAEFPENTLEALACAVELGARFIEFDVQLTGDLVPVLIHDADLARVAGRPERIHELTWATLSGIPVAEVERLGERHRATYPPSLAQFVQAFADWSDVTAFVELKRASIRRFGHETMLRRVSEVLQPVLDRCVLISFDLVATKLARLMTGERIGWVLTEYDEPARAQAASLAPEFLFVDVDRLPADAAPLWHGPWEWAVYEVRDLETARACRARGANYVETMDVRGLMNAYGRGRTRP